MGVRLLKILKRWAVLLAISAITLLAIRAYDSQRGQPLEPWHTYVPHELSVKELDHVGWTEYLKAEDAVFEGMRSEVTQKLDPEDRIPVNRYFEGSPIYPGHFSQDWNHSIVLEPDGPPAGAGCSPPWADRFTLQPPPHRPALLRARLSLDSSEIAWSWHGSGRPDGRRMGRLVGGDAACRERSLQTHWSVGSVAPCRVSLSHVALSFPTSDSLYGLQPDPAENFGINLGAIAARGERGTLIVNLDSLLRMSSNPFFPYLIERTEESIKPSAPREPGTP